MVTLWRELADVNPLAFEPELAKSLNHLGVCHRQLGEPDEAVVVMTECVAILRRLSAGNLSAHQIELAAALDHLGDQLALVERPDEALAAGREAVEVFRRLAADNPARHDVDLAKALDNLGIRLATVDRPSEALGACESAVEIFEQLAANDPEVSAQIWREPSSTWPSGTPLSSGRTGRSTRSAGRWSCGGVLGTMPISRARCSGSRRCACGSVRWIGGRRLGVLSTSRSCVTAVWPRGSHGR